MTLARATAAMTLALLTACSSKLPVHTILVADQPVKVEVAATADHRATGLMNRDHLNADEGMLFIYGDEKPRSFWMKNTRIPLDIAFIKRDGTIVKIAQMPAFTTDRTQSLYPATYALEMNVGWFEANGVEVGEKITDIPTELTIE
ncbi:MAG: DUF192 domain-containing protein [Proteobacteria bacterium]|nr:DUF192 domain-containing protein [Pseudomonadota bacterium]